MASESLISLRNKVEHWTYTKVAKPVFFRFDPEFVHDQISFFGRLLGGNPLTRATGRLLFGYSNPMLECEVAGISFANPIGLAAGFDKNARLLQILPEVGLGFAEIGSVTARPCRGNAKPRLYRLPRSRSLVVYYGLMNDGAEAIAGRMEKESYRFPVGTSIAPTNDEKTADHKDAIAEYVAGCRRFARIGAYTTINLSCPNTGNNQPFHDPGRLEELLAALEDVESEKPVFLKISPDLELKDVEKLMAVADKHKVTGFITTNLTKKRENEAIKDTKLPDKGGMSGKVVQKLSDRMVRHVAGEGKGRFVVIGCGGVFTAEDAYRKILLGASLVQLITGMIYEGPEVISMINQGLVRLLKRDGFESVGQAVGRDL